MIREQQMSMFDSVTAELKAILNSKGNDYASNTDVLSNFKLTASALKTTSHKIILTEIVKKAIRLGNLIDKDPENESVQDSLKDLMNYCFLDICALHDNRPHQDPTIKINTLDHTTTTTTFSGI